MNKIYTIILLLLFLIIGSIVMFVNNTKQRNIILLILGILSVVMFILLILPNNNSKVSPKPKPKPTPTPTPKSNLNYKNKGQENPKDFGGIYARDGFGNKVDWWFALKLPSKMMSQEQIENLKLLPKDYTNNLVQGVYDEYGTMGTNFTKGWLTTSISPSTEFIQNWAPEDNFSFMFNITVDKNKQISDLLPLFEKWLGTINNNNLSFVDIFVNKKEPVKTGTSVQNLTVKISEPYNNWNNNLEGPDSSSSVNTWRAWLRVIEAMNLVQPSFNSGKITYDISKFLNLEKGNVIMEKLTKWSKTTGVAYDFTNCALSIGSSFSAGNGDYKNSFINMCAHCNCNGNDIMGNIWQNLKPTRVDNNGKIIKPWTPITYNLLLQEVIKYINDPKNGIGTQVNSEDLATTITNYIVSNEPGGSNKNEINSVLESLSSIINDIYKDILAFVTNSYSDLYDPTGRPICGFNNPKNTCVKASKIKENYGPSKPKIMNYTRGPDCQGNYKDSSLNYFLPPWAKVKEGVHTAHPANPTASAPSGSGLASVLNSAKRGSSVCYVYADSNNPKLRYFRSVENTNPDNMSAKEKSLFNNDNATKLDPLGQNSNDPASKTLDQLFYAYRNKSTHWSFWTDQMYEPGDSYVGTAGSGKNDAPEFDIQKAYNEPMPGDGREQGTIYPHKGAGCSAPGAHSKGVLCYDDESNNGFWLGTTIPMYPDVSLTGIGENIRLGCQLDNNSSFAQHLFCCSLDKNAMEEMLKAVKTAMICGLESPTCKVDAISGFNYGFGIDSNYIIDNQQKLGMYQCSSTGGMNNPYKRDNKELNDANSFTYDKNAKSQIQIFQKNSSDVGFVGKDNILCNSNCKTTPKDVPNSLAVISKAPADNRPPWVIVSEFLQTDLSVSGWWDNLNGTPSYCNGLNYTNSTNEFCLNDYRNPPIENFSYLENGIPKYNVERIMAITIKDIPDPVDKTKTLSRSFTQFGKMWYVGNHAKWGVSTPRNSTDPSNEPKYVILGDMNGGGYPASKVCNSNQFGRGGTFFVVQSDVLHDSLIDCIELVCACNKDGDNSKNFCGWGGYPGELEDNGFSNDPTYGRIDAWDTFVKWPEGNSSGSYWDNKFTQTGGVNKSQSKAWKRYS